jgi:uncharacterized repeat protein (TIGR01451 family)
MPPRRSAGRRATATATTFALALVLTVLPAPGRSAAAAGSPAAGGSTVRIGSTSPPAGATMPPSSCTTGSTTELVPYRTAAGTGYAVPAGGGSLTSWSFNATGARAGTPYELLVARPAGSGYQIVATDPETVPSGAGRVVSFTLAHPIAVQGGDLVGSVVSPSSHVGCLFKGGSIPSSDVLGFSLSPDRPGSTFTPTKTIPDELVNVSATVAQSDDLALTDTAEPASVTLGDDVTFVLGVSSTGPSSSPTVVVKDTLPAGLAFVSASAGTGTCQASAQTVKCTLPGAPASVSVVARPSRTGSFQNTATVTGPLVDPRPGDNTATAAVRVTK